MYLCIVIIITFLLIIQNNLCITTLWLYAKVIFFNKKNRLMLVKYVKGNNK